MVLSCGAICRTILHDAMPLIETMCIDKASQMNMAVASRFRDIKEIHINSLYKVTIDDGLTDFWVDTETKIRVMSFISRFALLERVNFWGRDSQGNIKAAAESHFVGEGESYPDEGSRESMLSFVDMVSGGYICGALPRRLKISGLVCPDAGNTHGLRGNDCKTCLRACKSFPLDSVAEFDCRGSSASNGRAGRMYGLDVCLEKATLESIIENRSDTFFLMHSTLIIRVLTFNSKLFGIDQLCEDCNDVKHFLLEHASGSM